jgi:hypothetical protein
VQTCCAECGDPASLHPLFLRAAAANVFVSFGQCELPMRRVAYTVYWDRALRPGTTFDVWLSLPSEKRYPDRWLITRHVRAICRLHLVGRCGMGCDCKYVHVCPAAAASSGSLSSDLHGHDADRSTSTTPPVPDSAVAGRGSGLCGSRLCRYVNKTAEELEDEDRL